MAKTEGRADYSFDEFNIVLAGRFDGLSKQLKKIARFILDNPVDTALDTAAEIANRLEVQPSSLIRFAQALDFEASRRSRKSSAPIWCSSFRAIPPTIRTASRSSRKARPRGPRARTPF
ncbi:MurR/RpiR family transcriptional regulator [Kordiimonas gwangyangensis]|uniref:MurR/RpiR family transcriptional regulator n=1 Tax=Kordiimonas gwangyangensis TaxID=288022 RepID=UPI0009DCCE43|nr:MurR/RpiR family transcriptional regulator [Kordiimonas gwangyangensis]